MKKRTTNQMAALLASSAISGCFEVQEKLSAEEEDRQRKLCKSCSYMEMNDSQGHCYMFEKFMPNCKKLKITE